MKIIKESERINEGLNKPYMYGYWNKLNKYCISEGLTVIYDTRKTINYIFIDK